MFEKGKDRDSRGSYTCSNQLQQGIDPDCFRRAGYDAQVKTLFIWEGVTYYLEADSVAETLEFVSQTGGEGSAIAFDYTALVNEENIEGFGVKAFFELMKEHHGGEALTFAVEEGEIENYLGQRGLKLVEHLDNECD